MEVHRNHEKKNAAQCPKCRCKRRRSTGNMAEYPEVYVKRYCAGCGFLTDMADNSRSYNCYEFADFVIDII